MPTTPYALDPKYQAQLYTIEAAMRDAGIMPSEPRKDTSDLDVFDEQLLKLIDAVPME